jgi:hypothetical protein
MTSTYEVSRPSGVCAATGRVIEIGEPFVAALVERLPDGHLERVDYSSQAWAEGARPGPGSRLIGTWRGTMRPAEGPRRSLIDDAELLDLFEQLAPATEVRQQAFRYILALILIRKRLLRMVGTLGSGAGGLMLVQMSKAAGGGADDPPLEVIDPGLDDQTIADATEQLGAVMLGGEPGGSSGPGAS